MKNTIIMTLIIFVTTSCATSKQIVGPDGTKHELVTCQGIEYCYEKSQQVCGGKYKIVNTSSDTSSLNGTASTTTNLLVKCLKN